MSKICPSTGKDCEYTGCNPIGNECSIELSRDEKKQYAIKIDNLYLEKFASQSQKIQDLEERVSYFENLYLSAVKENEELKNIIRNGGLPNDCVAGWDEVKFCPNRQGEGNMCMHCMNF